MRNTKKIAVTISLLAVAAGFIANLPELRRYLRIRRM
ncbi:MAG: hypothetical protein JWR19_1866 [Pedosphaera sp.]|jgi:hypothetical protein|nr:hypothetical protein [Pedosphaera sp.]